MLIKLTLTTGEAQLVNTDEITSARSTGGGHSFIRTKVPFELEVKEDLDDDQDSSSRIAHHDPDLVRAARKMIEMASSQMPWTFLNPDKVLPETMSDGKPVSWAQVANDPSAGDDPDRAPFRLEVQRDGPADPQPERAAGDDDGASRWRAATRADRHRPAGRVIGFEIPASAGTGEPVDRCTVAVPDDPSTGSPA